jgi:2-keto-4-pentenoate hydratase/2-oxohepta-3-ene-1,7-dioic acid hydratase in catechol pathway
MKLLTHLVDGVERAAVLDDRERAHDLPEGARVIDVIGEPDRLASLGRDALARDGVPVEELDVRSPLRPVAIRDFSVFAQHNLGMQARRGITELAPDFWDFPIFYFSNPWAVVGPYDDVPVPPGCSLFDFELELGVVIGRPGRNIRPEDAQHHVAGYLVFNDWSARDLQRIEMPRSFGPAKGKDTVTTLGPYLVTPDELPSTLDVVGRVGINGVPFGEDTFANMGWTFASLIAYSSRGAQIGTGDLIGSGTCGNGCIAETWGHRGDDAFPPLAVGDVVTMSIDGLGEQRSRIVEGDEIHPIRAVGR